MPLPPPPDLPASDVLYLRPGDPEYAAYLPATNKRTQLSPSLRAVCKSERAASVLVDWVRANNLNFAVRCGGHSYEGFSQSTDVVIDVRGLSKIAVDKTAGLVTVGQARPFIPSTRRWPPKDLRFRPEAVRPLESPAI